MNQYKIKPYNTIFTIYRIPFQAIEKANVSLKDKNKNYSLKKHCEEQKWDIGINGVMFDMGTYQNVTDLIVKGKLNNGGNYSNIGIAFGNDFPNIGAYKSTTSNSNGKMVDFLGGAPTLIIDGKINMDMKGLSNSFSTQVTQRTAIGINQYYIFILSTLEGKANLNSVATELLKQGCTTAINKDGGGSTSLYVDGKVLRTGRNIPTAFGIKLKPKTTQTPQPIKTSYRVALDSGHSKVVSGKRSPDGKLLEYEFNMDICKRIQKHLERHGVDSKIFQVENTNLTAELNERIRLINNYNPTISVSIHANAHGSGSEWTSAKGWELFYYTGSTNGLKLAKSIHAETVPLGLTDRGIKTTSSLAMVKRPKAPAVLVEHAFMTNKADCDKLKSNAWRDKFAIADTKGILKYLGVKWVELDEESKVETVIKPDPDVLYKVQTGAFGNKDNAEKLKSELESKGYSTLIKEEKK